MVNNEHRFENVDMRNSSYSRRIHINLLSFFISYSRSTEQNIEVHMTYDRCRSKNSHDTTLVCLVDIYILIAKYAA